MAPPGMAADPDKTPSYTSRACDMNELSLMQVLGRGRLFFNKVYGKVAGLVQAQLDGCGTQDLSLAVRLVYGYFLSNTDVLSDAETSFVLIAGLMLQDVSLDGGEAAGWTRHTSIRALAIQPPVLTGQVNAQLRGHLVGALDGGAAVEEVMAVRSMVIRICEAAGMKMLGEDEVGGWGWRSEMASPYVKGTSRSC